MTLFNIHALAKLAAKPFVIGKKGIYTRTFHFFDKSLKIKEL